MLDESISDRKQAEKNRRARLDDLITGDAEILRLLNENHAGWALNLFTEAGEASGSFRSSTPPSIISAHGAGDDKARSSQEASRRARGQNRRYCAHNQLNRLGILTF